MRKFGFIFFFLRILCFCWGVMLVFLCVFGFKDLDRGFVGNGSFKCLVVLDCWVFLCLGLGYFLGFFVGVVFGEGVLFLVVLLVFCDY